MTIEAQPHAQNEVPSSRRAPIHAIHSQEPTPVGEKSEAYKARIGHHPYWPHTTYGPAHALAIGVCKAMNLTQLWVSAEDATNIESENKSIRPIRSSHTKVDAVELSCAIATY